MSASGIEPGIESGFERLAVEREAGGVVRVWLARPEKLNALDTRTLEELIALYRSFERDFTVRVAVLGGHGRAFCAGADRGAPPGTDYLLTGQGATPRERRWWSQLGRRAVAAIAGAEVVTLARLHGYVLGGGLCLAVACDFRIATPDARLGLPEVDLGIPLTWGGTARLVHEVGAARARELVMLGDDVDGARAEAIGLVHRVVPPDELDVMVTDWATRLAAKPEVAIHMAKTQLRGLARQEGLGDTTETDGDLLLAASSGAAAVAAFGAPPPAEGWDPARASRGS
jgi:enoyl-CoA hydratase/carnithine racemase